MTPTAPFEDRLLGALLDRFDALTQSPSPAADPVPSLRRTGVRRYAVPVGCLTATSMAALVLLATGLAREPASPPVPATALAAWTTGPTSADQTQLSQAAAQCTASLGQPGPGAKQAPLPPGGPWTPVLVDTRADLTLALYTDGTRSMTCLAGPSFVSVTEVVTTGQAGPASDAATLDNLLTRPASGEDYTVAIGRLGGAVTGVALQRTDGSVVTGTVENGDYIAWWPGDQGVTALAVTTSSGTQTNPVEPRFGRSQPNNTVSVITLPRR